MKKGFTLIELLVVIAIIGILAAMILASITGARKKARDAQRKNDLRQVKTALEQYMQDNQEKYPITTTWGVCGTTPSGMMGALCAGSYMKNTVADPLNTGSNVYTYTSSDGSTYTMQAYLESPVGAWPVTPD